MAAEDLISGGLTGLLGGIFGGVVLAGVATIALTKLADKLGEGLYGLLAALPRRAADRIALVLSEDKRITRYRAGIPDRYGRHMLTRQRRIDVESLYVPLQYESGGRRHDLRRKVLRERAVLLLGEAGAGKSLLSKYLLLRWAELPRKARAAQRIPVLVELHRRTGDIDLIGLIAQRFRLPRDRDDARAREFVARRLDDGALRVIFDGLDEVATDQQSAVVAELESFREDHAGGVGTNAVMVTCRESAYTGTLGNFERVIIAGFDDSSILRFLDLWLTIERAPQGGLSESEKAELGTAESFFDRIRQNPQLHQLARTPLLLNLLADLYTGSLVRRGRTLPTSRAAFYARVTDHMITRDLLLDRGERASPYEPGDKLAVLRRVALTMTEEPAPNGDRLIIERERLRKTITTTLTALDLRVEYGRELLRDLLDRSQMLIGSDTGDRYWFPHRSFQEYFTARALAGPTGVERLLAGYRSDPAFWHDTVSFWCGLDGTDATAVVEPLFAAEDAQHRVLALECLAEASEVAEDLADRIVAHFLAQLPAAQHVSELNSTIAALGSLAGRNTERGRLVRARLEEYAENHLDAAILALARSGRADAAEFLVRLAARVPDSTRIAGGLRSMGDTAVPALAEAAGRGSLWALDILGEIGTPSAAIALAGFVWDRRERTEPTRVRAAWWLAVRLRRFTVESALADRAPLGDRKGDYAVVDNAWDPFTEEPHGRLAQLVGRIAFLADQSQPPSNLAERVDPRIAILLASLMLLRTPREGFSQYLKSVAPQEHAVYERERYGPVGARHTPVTQERVLAYLRDLPTPRTRIRMLKAMPKPVRQALFEMLIIYPANRPYDDSERASQWSRAARDTEHRTRELHFAWVTLLTAAVLATTGAGIYRLIATVTHTWPWGTVGLAWTILLAAAGWTVAFLVFVLLDEWDYGDWFLPAVLAALADLMCFVGFAVAGVQTILSWFGSRLSAVALAATLMAIVLLGSLARRLDRESNNPFRRVIHAHRRAAARHSA